MHFEVKNFNPHLKIIAFSYSGLEINQRMPSVGWTGHIRIPKTDSPVSKWKIYLDMNQPLTRIETWQPKLNVINDKLYLMIWDLRLIII